MAAQDPEARMNLKHFMLKDVQRAIKQGDYRLTVHALERCVERVIAPLEIKEAILSGEVIEYYPRDKYGPSCLILGKTGTEKILHVLCSISPVWIITSYEPALKTKEWTDDFRIRRKKS